MEQTRNKVLIVLSVWSLIFVVILLGRNSPIHRMSEAAVTLFHQRITDHRYLEIYQDSTQEFQTHFDEGQMIALWKDVRRYGLVKEQNIYKLGYDERRSGETHIYVVCRTTFSDYVSGPKFITEQFEFMAKGNAVRLHSYKNNLDFKQ